jgi:hypothetical protein
MSAGALVVTGDPDVGKSALSLRALEALRAEGAAVVSLGLRDLPSNMTEFEGQLGGSGIDDVLATGESRLVRLLLIDSAESVLEGKGATLQALAQAALNAGIGVVAVTRTDGARPVGELLARSSELSGTSTALCDHIVRPLTDDEQTVITRSFTVLSRLEGDLRTSWLLGRPGLVDVLLQTGQAVDPADFLCEADVFMWVWHSLIRNDEICQPGAASPDDRDRAAIYVAQRTLGGAGTVGPIQGTAAAELRSIGVLRSPNNPALSPGDEFATDLFRDFALCRLFLTQGWDALASAGAPRWSIRAARLGCQALLAQDRVAAWARLSEGFGAIARDEGDRWLEIPYEALLTLGDADSAIRELWGELTANDGRGLRTLLRLAHARYVNGATGDPFALAPLVKATFCELPIDQSQPTGRRTVEEARQALVLAWLRGMAIAERPPNSLRMEVRDIILDRAPSLDEDFVVEALASLGQDIDDRAEAWLRKVARQQPHRLNPAVESPEVARSLSLIRPSLLLDLAESYYIERPRSPELWGGGRSHLDDGIRGFRHGPTPGFGVPQAAWYYGPFFSLLNTTPLEAVGLINRMLDHAAAIRVEHFRSDDPSSESETPVGVFLDIPEIGSRLYVGDSHVWAWYRGTGIGPHPCMSALLALERFIDHLLDNLEVSPRRILELLLRDCHNLAVLGLAVGFLTRHPDATGDLLDPFLASPSVWYLENSRVTSEYGLAIRDLDADKLAGGESRRHTFHDTVGKMVMEARLAGDEERLAQLEEIGGRLLETAEAELAEVGDAVEFASVTSWAAEFRIENYRATRRGADILVEFVRPEEIAQVLAPRNEELQTTNLLFGLQNRYSRLSPNPEEWPIETLRVDLAEARRLYEVGIPSGFLWPEDPIAAVASAAVRAYSLGRAVFDPDDLMWAAEVIMLAAENPRIGEHSYSATTFPTGADRLAAVAAPCLLLEPFDDIEIDRQRLGDCLGALATSLYDEVRMAYAEGCLSLWSIPCARESPTGECTRHRPAWDAAISGLGDCRLGAWSQHDQRRVEQPLTMPYHESLPHVPGDDLLLNRLRMPTACMADAHRVTCLEDSISDLWAPLWSAHRRGLVHWWKEGYDHQPQAAHEPIARRMVQIVLDGDLDPTRGHIEAVSNDTNALHLLFNGFAAVFTEDALRPFMADFWPWALEAALDAVGDASELRGQHHWFGESIAALLPVPKVNAWDPDSDSKLARSRADWLSVDALDDLVERWLRLARWEPKAVDAVIQFARCAPVAWQVSVALDWIERIIDGRYELMANHLWFLEDWLIELHPVMVGDVRSRYHRVIDGLAAAGDVAAVRLQQLDE